ncbi:Bbp16 family capsid cement protein [Pseudoxanthomonas mexicana]
MIIDSNNEFSVAQAITSDANSTNVLEIAKSAQAGAVQFNGRLAVLVTTTFSGADSLAIQLVTADDEALTTNAKVVARTPAIATANLVASRRLWVTDLPKVPYRKCLGLKYVVANGPFTDGMVSAFIADVVNSEISTYHAPSTIHPNA